jgi:hypothetical protein
MKQTTEYTLDKIEYVLGLMDGRKEQNSPQTHGEIPSRC